MVDCISEEIFKKRPPQTFLAREIPLFHAQCRRWGINEFPRIQGDKTQEKLDTLTDRRARA